MLDSGVIIGKIIDGSEDNLASTYEIEMNRSGSFDRKFSQSKIFYH